MMLDSNLCIAALRRRPPALEWLKRQMPSQLALSSVVVFELRQGVALSRDPAAESAKVDAFLVALTTVPFDDAAAAAAGLLGAALQRAGKTIGPFDLLIAGHAVARSEAVVTANVGEFGRVAGLAIVDWSQQSP